MGGYTLSRDRWMDQWSGEQVIFTPQVKAGGVGQGWGAVSLCPGLIQRAPQGWVTARGQGWAHTGQCLIWEQGGHWAGGQWGWPGRALMPLGCYPSVSLKQATDEIGQRLADTRRGGLMIQGSPGAGTGDSLGRTLSLPRPLSLLPRGMAVLDREPAGAEREGEKWGLGAQGCAGTVVAGPQKEAPPP